MNLVVGDEDQLEEVLRVRIVVDDTANGRGQGNDALRNEVTGRHLATDEAGTALNTKTSLGKVHNTRMVLKNHTGVPIIAGRYTPLGSCADHGSCA